MHLRLFGFGVFLMSGLVAASCGAGSGTTSGGEATGGAATTGGVTDASFIDGLASIRIDPGDGVVEVSPGKPGTLTYKVTGTIPGKPDQDITDRVVLSLADATLGTWSGGVLTSDTLRGGETMVTARANGGAVTATAKLTVHFTAVLRGPSDGGPALPADPGASFTGTADAARAPELVYPNSGVMLPPNIGSLEVHYRPGSPKNTLFQLTWSSNVASVVTYLRCPSPTNGGCIFQLDPVGYAYLVDSNGGGEPVKLTVRGGDDAATGFGASATISVSFAEAPVRGGLYYWTTTGDTAIMRFDFGAVGSKPEVFLSPGGDNLGKCVGCHALSRDGTKMVASLGGQNDGRIVYLNDLSKGKDFALKGDTDNHIQFASFNPAGDRFVSMYGDTAAPERNKLYFHDGATGKRIPEETMLLPFEPDHPDWSPDGKLIAIDHVGIHQTSQHPLKSGIELMAAAQKGFDMPKTLIPAKDGLNRYNPSFSPDSAFLLYSESTCPGGDNMNGDCDGDADPTAKTWAVLAKVGSTPVRLDLAGKPGVADGANTNLSDTFPRFSPFQQSQGKGRLFWATISSRRKLGLRDPGGRQLLWMFAVFPDKVLAGQDGSSPGFFLPFQDLTTSNHIAQWTQMIVKPPQ
jgi:hypothetical protein